MAVDTERGRKVVGGAVIQHQKKDKRIAILRDPDEKIFENKMSRA